MKKKWAKYSVYDGAGRLVLTFKGHKVKNIKPGERTSIGFRPLTDAVSSQTINVEVECTCGEEHEEHLEL